jgi:hypothetical protein
MKKKQNPPGKKKPTSISNPIPKLQRCPFSRHQLKEIEEVGLTKFLKKQEQFQIVYQNISPDEYNQRKHDIWMKIIELGALLVGYKEVVIATTFYLENKPKQESLPTSPPPPPPNEEDIKYIRDNGVKKFLVRFGTRSTQSIMEHIEQLMLVPEVVSAARDYKNWNS